MIERLGQVLYWAGCAGAALALVAGIYGFFSGSNGEGGIALGFMVFAAAAVWALGRACRYVLAGT